LGNPTGFDFLSFYISMIKKLRDASTLAAGMTFSLTEKAESSKTG
jgi:hypothetical protein